uniref:DNA topoisomerase 6 subunit B n=1 Tax=Tetradesmus obliquus TaxID=3088 RepID=A0A383WIB7_TETOB|eukprot:jgi/Sobl393_1/2507/SZX76889.1
MSKAGKGGSDKLQQKSPAEFFAENKNIAGFDNPGKCLYTTVRELVENALDSAESISVLPLVEITIEEVSRARLNTLRGLGDHARVDEQLYHDYESEDARKKRLAKEAKEKQRLEKLAASKGEAAAAAAAADAARKAADGKKAGPARGTLFYKVTVKDNGCGMSHADIPNMLGRVLSGTKYGVKQTRGKFGLGAKMALIWSKMTTGLPFSISSALRKQDFRSQYELDIDIHKNAPNVHSAAKLPNADGWHGACLSLTIEGNWSSYRAKLLKYLRQIAVITPYAQFSFQYIAEDPKSSLKLTFRRRTDVMPPPPKITKHHPSSVDLELVKRLITETKATSLSAFLTREFDQVSKALSGRLIGELRSGGVNASTDPKQLSSQQVVRLHQLLHEVRFADPSGSHLSPAGEYNLRLGVMKELQPELIATHAGDVRVFEGHAFIVEAAVSLGGRELRPGINVYRFANRIPLLFEGGSDVITRTATKRINWGSYKINQSSDRVGVFVSIVSTKIPFKGAGKEYIGDDVEEMVSAVKAAIQQCCAQLRVKIAKALALREQQQRRRNLTKYIPDAAGAIFTVLAAMAGSDPRGPKRRRLQDSSNLLQQVARKEVVQAMLEKKLAEHVERIDTDMALEFQVAQGLAGGAAKQQLWLAPLCDKTHYGAELHANACVVRLLH